MTIMSSKKTQSLYSKCVELITKVCVYILNTDTSKFEVYHKNKVAERHPLGSLSAAYLFRSNNRKLVNRLV